MSFLVSFLLQKPDPKRMQSSAVDPDILNFLHGIDPIPRINQILSIGIKFHSMRRIEKIYMKLVQEGNKFELRWERVTGKKFKVNLAEVENQLPGKQTENFLKELSSSAKPDCCLSLITDRTTIDLECMEKLPDEEYSDRDALFYLLRKVVEQAKSFPQENEDRLPTKLEEITDPAITANAILFKGVYLHSGKGPIRVSMNIDRDDLRWFSDKSGKQYVASLSKAININSGKSTPTFLRAASIAAVDGRCLSVLFEGSALDIECLSLGDREILVRCLKMIIGRFREL